MWTSSDELAHYGVKGMEWGRRKKEDENLLPQDPKTATAARNYLNKYQDYRRLKAKYFAGKARRADMDRARAEATELANEYRRRRMADAEAQRKYLEIQNEARIGSRIDQMDRLVPDFTSGSKERLDFTSASGIKQPVRSGNVKLEEREGANGTKNWVNTEFYKKYLKNYLSGTHASSGSTASGKSGTHASSGKTSSGTPRPAGVHASSGSTASGKTRTHASGGSTASGTPRPAGVHASSGSTASGKSRTHASSGKSTSKKRRKTVPIPIEKKTM